MIHTIAGNSEWMSNSSVRTAIVKNPKTPMNIVQKHIGGLSEYDLIQLAKSEHVKDGVSKFAKRTLASRGKSIK
jgi:seryl-tRNA(Sec) selenium transferase